MLTKKDFIGFAESVAAEVDPEVRRKLIRTYIEIGKGSNPRFDAERFVDFVVQLMKRM